MNGGQRQYLNRLLQYTGLTQREIAEQVGIAQATISRMSQGHGSPANKSLRKLIEHLEGDWSQFVDLSALPDSEPMPPRRGRSLVRREVKPVYLHRAGCKSRREDCHNQKIGAKK